jgi:hypothetical protein
MQILLKKGNHKAMVVSQSDEISMVSWIPGMSAKDKFITGVRTEILGEKEAPVFTRKFVRMLQANGYEINFEKK